MHFIYVTNYVFTASLHILSVDFAFFNHSFNNFCFFSSAENDNKIQYQ